MVPGFHGEFRNYYLVEIGQLDFWIGPYEYCMLCVYISKNINVLLRAYAGIGCVYFVQVYAGKTVFCCASMSKHVCAFTRLCRKLMCVCVCVHVCAEKCFLLRVYVDKLVPLSKHRCLVWSRPCRKIACSSHVYVTKSDENSEFLEIFEKIEIDRNHKCKLLDIK